MNRTTTISTKRRGRLTSWLRKGYPRSAPERGHSYLVALCGAEYHATR